MPAKIIDRQRAAQVDHGAVDRRAEGAEGEDVVDEIVMIEIECGPALDRWQPFPADTEERTRAQAGVIEVQSRACATQEAVAEAILPAAADAFGVDVLLALFNH